MNKPLKLVAIGNSTGVILPKEVLAKLGLGQGDELHMSDIPDGVQLRRGDPEFERQMAVAREIMREWRPALRELAK